MAQETQELGGFNVVGITTRTTNAGGQAAADINALWLRFFEEAVGEAIPHKDGKAIYALYHDYEGDHEKPYSLTIGCRVESTDFAMPEGMTSQFVPKADYAVFAAAGEQPKALLDTWQSVWKSDLPRSYDCDVEIYGPRFFEEGLHEILVCIGVKL
jgi:predicted transcriptional regulator YdeE